MSGCRLGSRRMVVHSLSDGIIRTLALIGCSMFVRTSQAQDLRDTKGVLDSALAGQGQLSWVQTTTTAAGNKVYSVNATSRVSDGHIDTQSCVFTFRLERSFPDYRIHMTWTVRFAEIDRVEFCRLLNMQTKRAKARDVRIMF